MQKTRFEGQTGPASAAARPSRLLSGLIFGAAIAIGGCVETSKATGGREVNGANSFMRSPEGALPPKGIELIEFGMSEDKVYSLLSETYEIYRYKSDVEENVTVFRFPYYGEGEFNVVKIYFRHRKVYYLSFGFPYFN